MLHVPEISANLLSVYKMVCQGNEIVFNADGCHIYNSEKKLIVLIKPDNGTYKLKASPVYEKGLIARKSEIATSLLWHRRLGHVSAAKLKQMRDSAVIGVAFNDSGEIKRCEVCVLGKHAREPFPMSETRAKNILDLVHSDLCGPMRNKSAYSHR